MVAVQPDLFTAAAEARAADEAIARGLDNADPGWPERALAAIERAARALPDLISDDVWAYGLDEPHDARSLGGVMRKAARAGLIVSTDRQRPSSRTGCHAMPRTIWRSLVFEGA